MAWLTFAYLVRRKVSADVISASEYVKDFEKIMNVKTLSPEQVFSIDETELFWKCLPSRTLLVMWNTWHVVTGKLRIG